MNRYIITTFLILALLLPASALSASDNTVEVNGWDHLTSFISFTMDKLFDAPSRAVATLSFAVDGVFAEKPEDMGLSIEEELRRAAEDIDTEVFSLSDINVPFHGGEQNGEDRDFLAMLSDGVTSESENDESGDSSSNMDSKPGGGVVSDLPPSSWDTDHYDPDVLNPDRESGEENNNDEPEEEVRNISWCEFDIGEFPDRNIMINEVAWMGTESDSTKEWVELKNRRSREVSLEGYQLIGKSGEIKISFTENDSIPAYGYYLILNGDESDIQHSSVDKVFDGIIKNSNEELRLFGGDCNLIDKVSADSDWPGGNEAMSTTMTRSSETGWRSSEYAGGTPGIENSSQPPENPLP